MPDHDLFGFRRDAGVSHELLTDVTRLEVQQEEEQSQKDIEKNEDLAEALGYVFQHRG